MKKNFISFCIPAVIVAAGIFNPVSSFSQNHEQQTQENGTVHMAANTSYNKAGKFKRMMLGEHYRKEWATAVDIKVINLDSVGGGLTALKMGGGMQTKSLRLQGANGQEYVLRSVDKDPSKAIVAELRGTFAEDVVQDQISSSNPYAPTVVASLLDAAGIFHTTPQLVYVPRSERLGEYANIFGETLCLLEERPAGNQETNAAYGYSKNIVNSEKLFEKVFSNSNHQVDERAFLKARIFDMLIGDWDRHEDQWVWASFKEDDKTIYKPIPRDRDQAFSNLDGFIPHLASQKWAVRKTKNFESEIKDINGLNIGGNHLDRNFTTRLTLNEWMIITHQLQNELTNEVIDAAFKKMPAEIYAVSGEKTKAKLKSRKDKLDQYVKTYYAFLAKEIAITGTKDKEIFDVQRINDDSTSVTIYQSGKNNAKGDAVYQKVFLRSETKEIRLYGLEGNDIFNINGETDKGILVRVIGGKGQDLINDNSEVKGMSRLTRVYDNADNIINTSNETKKFISSDTLKNEYKRKSYKYDWWAPVQRPGFNPDDGVYVGGGIIWRKQQFGKSPYGFVQSIGGNYAFKTGAYTFWYNGNFKEAVGKWDLQLNANINAPNYSRNYFGLGNETEKNVETKNYYRVRFNQVTTQASLKRQFGKHHTIYGGLGFESVKIETSEDRYISSENSKLDSTDFNRKNYINAHYGYQFSTVNNPLYPTKGIKLSSELKYTQNLEENDKGFAQVSFEAATYKTFGRLTIASHAGVNANLGDDYEFFQANTLGLSSNLRGYRKDRFAGKTSVYTNTELRYRLSLLNAYVVKGSWGLLAFMDNGRVWMPDETSTEWHRGFGGGVWFLPFNKMAFTATYGVSKEENLVSLSAGFSF